MLCGTRSAPHPAPGIEEEPSLYVRFNGDCVERVEMRFLGQRPRYQEGAPEGAGSVR